ERERRFRREVTASAEQLLEALELPRVVAQDVCLLATRGTRTQERLQCLDVAVDRLRLPHVEAHVRIGVTPDMNPAERAVALRCRYRIEEEHLRRFRLAAAPARRLVQLQHLRPRLRELLLHRATGDLNEKGVAREDVEQ